MEAAVFDKMAQWYEAFAEHTAAETGGEAIALPAGVQLARTEQYAARPRFHRHHYRTERLSDFIRYAIANVQSERASVTAAEGSDNPTTYVNPDAQGATTVFDHGERGGARWGHHTAALKLKETPAWIAALSMSTGVKKQTDVIEWLEDWSTHVSAHQQNGDLIPNSRAIAALRRVKLEGRSTVVNVEADLARSQTTLESIEAKGDLEALPAYFIATTPLYVGTVELEIVMRLGVREQDGKPVLALRIVGRETLIQATADWLEKTITDAFEGKPMAVYVGAVAIKLPD